jgi:chromosome segregation protein
MPAARLKSLELVGYKTFASKTSLEFADRITCVVGPNGSGKSNIADALRWVLGEQAYSLMRGRKTDDMIFSGSETRARSGMASATVTFDNSSGWLPIDFSEVSITRRAYRDGQNEYLINSQKVRLRDVTELLSKSGLSQRTYTVIGQGMVDAALSLKAEDRRALFEEAAGISLYRQRREQALRRLDATRRNLERVEDILAELGPRLRSLERQAQRAQEAGQVRADLQNVLREWYGYHWHRAQRDYLDAHAQAVGREQSLAAERERQEAAGLELAEVRDRVNGLRARLSSWHRQLAQLHTQREAASRDLAVADERQRALSEKQAELVGELARRRDELALEGDRLHEAEARAASLEAEAADAASQTEAARQALAGRQAQRAALEEGIALARTALEGFRTRGIELSTLKADLQGRREQQGSAQADVAAEEARAAAEFEDAQARLAAADAAVRAARLALGSATGKRDDLATRLARAEEDEKAQRAELARLEAEQARLAAQLEVLAQAEANLAGYSSGAKALLEAARGGRLAGARGALSGQLTVPPELETAIAAALGHFVDAVLVQGDSEPALALLEREPARATLLPLDALAPPPPLTAPGGDGVLGVASALVASPPELRPALDLLLGQTLVTRDRRAARRALAGQPGHVRAVTLRGEVFAASGAIVVDSEGSAATLSRPRQRQELEAALGQAQATHADVAAALKGLAEQQAALREEMRVAEGALQEARKEQETAEAARQEAVLAEASAGRALDWQRSRKEALQQEYAQVEERLKAIERETADLAAQTEEAQGDLRARSAELAALPLDELLAEVQHWETRAAVGVRALEDARASLAERRASHARAQEQTAAMQRAESDTGAELAALRERARDVRTSETGIGGQIAELQALIEPAEAELREAEDQQAPLEEAGLGVRQALALAERAHTQAQVNLARRQEALDALRRRIEDDFGLVEFTYEKEVSGPTPLPLGELVERLPVVQAVAPDLEERLKHLRAQLRRMGAVNPEAQSEYRQVKERFESMTAQVADLVQAEADIKEIIAELDALMDREFRKTFDAVAAEFRTIFARLFPGGQARLLLTESEDPNDIGIDIEARLPGKRMQRLALLSGGERSLTAASLVFALLKASPTPFCVMDEVDAALDEANVERLRELLEEMSQSTQFVIITHNRNTVQAAQAIYGITMGRDTTSQTISLRLDEVDGKYAQA